MSRWHSVGAVDLSLEADPASLAQIQNEAGILRLTARNAGLTPATVTVSGINSSDLTVATTTASVVLSYTISLSRRPNIFQGAVVPEVKTNIGTWSPKSKGVATVSCSTAASSTIGLLGHASPAVDVTVT